MGSLEYFEVLTTPCPRIPLEQLLGGAKHDRYPFQNYSKDEKFEIVENWVSGTHLENHPVKPSDFLQYSVNNLAIQFGLANYTDLKDRPIYFLYHWKNDIAKNCKDIRQATTSDAVQTSFWMKADKHLGYFSDPTREQKKKRRARFCVVCVLKEKAL
ncbi:hypothetical protein FRX31_016534 [Thalictrum thalictroides]|uniref:Uncharacterized protein n=1 Tax=Thalictrum thalictroides TaxID=46969 RepID=A0A7J6W8W5_THATH|nr:hypothetical protein FRX31_016534 [Thalictrum thalictroides]